MSSEDVTHQEKNWKNTVEENKQKSSGKRVGLQQQSKTSDVMAYKKEGSGFFMRNPHSSISDESVSTSFFMVPIGALESPDKYWVPNATMGIEINGR